MQKCTKFENSLFHCILRSPSERSLKVLYSFRSCCCLFLCSIPVSFFVIQQKNFRRRSGSNLWWWVPLKQSPRPLDYHSLGQSCYGLFLLIYNLLLRSIPLFYVFEQKNFRRHWGSDEGSGSDDWSTAETAPPIQKPATAHKMFRSLIVMKI